MPESIELQIKPNIDLSSLEQQGAAIGKKLTSAINKNSDDAGKGYVTNINKAQRALDRFQKAWVKLDQTKFTPRLEVAGFLAQLDQERTKLSQLSYTAIEMEKAVEKARRQHKKKPYTNEEVAQANQQADAQLRLVETLEATNAEMKWYQKYDLADQTDKNKTALMTLVSAVREAEAAYEAAQKAEQDYVNSQRDKSQKDLAKQQAAEKVRQAKEEAQIYTDLQKRQQVYDKTTASVQKYVDAARQEGATLTQVSAAITQVVNRMTEIESFTGPPVLPGQEEEYARLAQTLEELQSRYETLAYSTQQYISTAMGEKASLEEVAAAVEAVRNRIAELEAVPNRTASEQQELEYLRGILPDLTERYDELRRAKDAASNQEAFKNAINETTAAVSRLIKKLAQLSGHAIKSTFNSVRKSITGMGYDSNDTSKEIQHLIRNIIKYGFGVRSIYFLYRRLRTALVDALKDMAKVDTSGLGASLNQLATSLQYLKSAWAAAFAPIIEYVTPVLVQLMDLLANVANAIAALFATLTGKGTVVKAVKQQKALAGALGNTGSAASDAAGKLAAFDELNIIGNDSGGGGGGGGGGAGDIPDGSFITETIEGELADLINANKWFEIGQLFADKLNTLTEAADKWINDVFRPWGVKWATNLGNFMNGFIYHYNWELLGKTFADGINAIFDTANTWYTTVNWSWFGSRVADGLISAIDNIEWDLIGQTLGNKLNKTIDFLYGFVKSLFASGRARQIADSIAEGVYNFFATIHWDNLGETISTGFNGVFDVLKRFINMYDWDGIGDTIANAINTAIRNLDAKKAGETLSTFVLKLFDQLGKIDLFAVGEKIGNFIASINWADIIGAAISNILKIVSGIIYGAFNGEYGVELAGIIAGALALNLGLAFAKIKFAELIGGQILKGALSSAGIGAATEGAAGATAGLSGALSGIAGAVGPIMGVVAALGGFVLMCKQSVDWLDEYNTKMHTLDDETQAHIDSIDLLIQQTEGYHEASVRQMGVYEVENDRVRELADSYLNLFDENGKVKAGMQERADYYYSQLANALGLEKDQLKALAEENGGLKTAIEQVITAKTQDRAISAYLDEYQYALNNTKTAQDAVTTAENDHKQALENAEIAQQNYQKALDDYLAIGAAAGDTTGEYKKRLDDAIEANSKAQYAIKATSDEVDSANEALLKINATAEFYEGYMAAIATNDTNLINAALKRMQDGFITAEEGDRESLKRQSNNMRDYYTLLLNEMEKGNPNVTQEMLDEAKGWVNTADAELAKLEKVGADGMTDLKSGMSSKKQTLISEAETTGQSIANAYKTALRGVLNGVDLGTPTASLPTYSYESSSGSITPKRMGYARLATGAVLPPNDPFLAIVGDQTHGTNIEAPLSTIEDAVRNVVGDSNYSPEVVQLLQRLITVVEQKNFSISRREVGDAAIAEINGRTRRTGNTPIIG